jgi:hypothetical protein
MHKEILGCEKKNNPKCSKLSILDEIMQFQKKKASSLEEKNDGCDLFGNEICHPVKGYDGLTYDIKSLIHLFSVKENGDYT